MHDKIMREIVYIYIYLISNFEEAGYLEAKSLYIHSQYYICTSVNHSGAV